jgi:hypothetical protein
MTSTGSTPALTIRKSSGITLTQAASSLPGITFTPANNTAVYMITAIFTESGNTVGADESIQLTDGTTVISTRDLQIVSGGYFPVTLTGIYAPATTSAVTVKLQGASSSGQTVVTAVGLAQAIEWTIVRIF